MLTTSDGARTYLQLDATAADLATGEVAAPALRFRRLTFHRSGDFVAPGDYTCTGCDQTIHLSRDRALPLCGRCESNEFTHEASLPAAGRQPLAA